MGACLYSDRLLVSQQQPVTITLFSLVVEPMIVDVGERVHSGNSGDIQSFMCVATGDPIPSISWEKDGQLVLPSLSDRIDIQDTRLDSPDRIVSSLTISGLAAGDGGTYTCYSSNGVGATSFSQFTLTVNPGVCGVCVGGGYN